MARQPRRPAGYMIVVGGYYNPRTRHLIPTPRAPPVPVAQLLRAIPPVHTLPICVEHH